MTNLPICSILHINLEQNKVHLSLALGEPTSLFVLDLSMAFDTIDHGTILDCLTSWFGVCETALQWFTSYLNNWFQTIKIHSTLSEDTCEVIYGVPQSSVLCPLLFSLYTTPVSKVIKRHSGIKFYLNTKNAQCSGKGEIIDWFCCVSNSQHSDYAQK